MKRSLDFIPWNCWALRCTADTQETSVNNWACAGESFPEPTRTHLSLHTHRARSYVNYRWGGGSSTDKFKEKASCDVKKSTHSGAWIEQTFLAFPSLSQPVALIQVDQEFQGRRFLPDNEVRQMDDLDQSLLYRENEFWRGFKIKDGWNISVGVAGISEGERRSLAALITSRRGSKASSRTLSMGHKLQYVPKMFLILQYWLWIDLLSSKTIEEEIPFNLDTTWHCCHKMQIAILIFSAFQSKLECYSCQSVCLSVHLSTFERWGVQNWRYRR